MIVSIAMNVPDRAVAALAASFLVFALAAFLVVPRLLEPADRTLCRLELALLLLGSLIGAALLGGCTHRDRVTVLAAGAMTLTACDMSQTLDVSNGGRWGSPAPDGHVYYEANPALGPDPGLPVMMGALAVTEAALVWVAATDKIPEWGKYAILGAAVAGEAYEVGRLTPVVGPCGWSRRR